MYKINDSMFVHPHWNSFPDTSYGTHVVFGVLMTLVLAVATIGNGSVIWIFCRCKALQTPSNILVMNLTLSDLLLALTGCPMYIISSFEGKWAFGSKGCNFHGWAGATFGFLSINTLACVALERCIVIHRSNAMQFRVNFKSAFAIVALLWGMTLAWTLPPIYGIWSRYAPEGLLTTCSIDYLTRSFKCKSYLLSIFFGLFILPLAIVTFCYVFITKLVFKRRSMFPRDDSQSSLKSGDQGAPAEKKKMSIEYKTARTAVLAVVMYTLSWSPYAAVALIGMFGNLKYLHPLVSQIPVLFAKASSIYNPFIYTLSHPKFRKEMHAKLPRFLFRFLTLGSDPKFATYSSVSSRTSSTRISKISRTESTT